MTKRSQHEDLTLNLKRLEKEYDLARRGLLVGSITGTIGILAALATLLAGRDLFQSGWQVVVLVGIVAAGIIVYFSFVFGRLLKMKVEISRTRQKIEVESGKGTRS